MLPLSPLMISAVYALAGLAGSTLKSYGSNDQKVKSRKGIVDVALGGLVGVLYPMLPLVPIPSEANIVQQFAFVAIISYFTADNIINLMEKWFGVKINDGVPPEATKLPAPPPPPNPGG